MSEQQAEQVTASELLRENADLRRQLDASERALLRELRKAHNVPTCCPACGVALKPKQAAAV